MDTKHSIPAKDADFDVAQKVIATTASAKRTDWNLDAAWLDTDLLPKKAEWDAAWAAYENPATRTKEITYTKIEKRNAYEPSLRTLVGILQKNPRVTAADLHALGIVVPSSSRTPAPVAHSYPGMRIDSSIIRVLSIFFHDSESTSRAKPAGQHGVEIRWGILDTPPADVEALTQSSFDTHSPFTLTFAEHERGKTVYFILRWENTRGEKGPWSEIVSAIIP